jgi:hypothetical protein
MKVRCTVVKACKAAVAAVAAATVQKLDYVVVAAVRTVAR